MATAEIPKGVKTAKEIYGLKKSIDQLSGASSPEQVEAIVNVVTRQTEGVMQDKDAQSVLFSIVDYIDESTLMNSIRKYWVDVPQSVKFLAMHSGTPHPFLLLARNGMRSGLLPYYEDPKMNEEYLHDTAEFEKQALKLVVKVGALFISELKVVAALLIPINKVMETEENFYQNIRTHLMKKRELETAVPAINAPALGNDYPKARQVANPRVNVPALSDAAPKAGPRATTKAKETVKKAPRKSPGGYVTYVD